MTNNLNLDSKKLNVEDAPQMKATGLEQGSDLRFLCFQNCPFLTQTDQVPLTVSLLPTLALQL